MKLHDYSSSMYNTIPLLGESTDAYEDRQLSSFINTSMRDIFLKHGVHQRFILLLMHRHFELEAKEKLVNVENVGMLWHWDRARADLLLLVVLTQWQFYNDGIVLILSPAHLRTTVRLMLYLMTSFSQNCGVFWRKISCDTLELAYWSPMGRSGSP